MCGIAVAQDAEKAASASIVLTPEGAGLKAELEVILETDQKNRQLLNKADEKERAALWAE